MRDSTLPPQPLFELWRHTASLCRQRAQRPRAASFCTLLTALPPWGGAANSAESPLLHRIRGRECEVRANLRTSRANQTDAAGQRL